MIDPNDPANGAAIDPVELHNTLAMFLGQTYQEVSKFDSHLVSANQTLAPKKQEFHRTAEQVLREARQTSAGSMPPMMHPQQRPPNISQRQLAPSVDASSEHVIAYVDPDQMEFKFDNSITAITINTKLDDLEKRIKRLDSTLEKVLSLLDRDESKNT